MNNWQIPYTLSKQGQLEKGKNIPMEKKKNREDTLLVVIFPQLSETSDLQSGHTWCFLSFQF